VSSALAGFGGAETVYRTYLVRSRPFVLCHTNGVLIVAEVAKTSDILREAETLGELSASFATEVTVMAKVQLAFAFLGDCR
jgi:hypothetical protein